MTEEMWLKTDKAMMEQSEFWPQWPLLPIKRYKDGEMQTALIYANMEGPALWSDGANLWDRDKDAYEWVPVNIDELLREGWKVD
jgi:hypothetical protein